MSFEVISRDVWDALPPKGLYPLLEHPIAYVSVSYVIVEGQIAGIEAVKQLQKRDMDAGQTDIQSNFLIAGDGVVFEGRGWKTQPGNPKDYPGKAGQFMEITYIGDFSGEDMNHPVYKSTASLLEMGVKNNYVSRAAKFLGIEDAERSKAFLPPPVVKGK